MLIVILLAVWVAASLPLGVALGSFLRTRPPARPVVTRSRVRTSIPATRTRTRPA